ncbi:MAG TPA: aminotransferase class I/II-fold pyridoxal phosphate-dependent enzyme [Solirubrobacteraceae bacterium]|nr:aminotransferase class I/II-fold pyridoxal phosphate-dependent enzyme [Solirubrobacteraceae bacterium]
MQIEPFEIERFYERWEFSAELMLSSSDCESRPLSELLALEPGAQERLSSLRLGYTEVAGSAELREAIAGTYEVTGPEDVLTLAAAEEGIFIAYQSLLGTGDHAVVEAPSYGSAVNLARSTGAEVTLWRRRHEDGWGYDLDELERLLRADTRFVYVNSPHNPTGSQMSAEEQRRLVAMLAERGTVLFSDEVYRGLEHDDARRLPAACDLYERAVSLNTVSKSYGLPGLRIGWVACRDPALLGRLRELKLYTTICSSAPSELLVEIAVRHSQLLIGQARSLVLENLPALEAFLARHAELLEWVPPAAGPIGFPRVRDDRDVRDWCEQTAAEAGVLLLPGYVYDEPRHIRMGYGRARLREALARLEPRLGAG